LKFDSIHWIGGFIVRVQSSAPLDTTRQAYAPPVFNITASSPTSPTHDQYLLSLYLFHGITRCRKINPWQFPLSCQVKRKMVLLFKSEFSGDKSGRKEFSKCVESIKMVLSIKIKTRLWLRNNTILWFFCKKNPHRLLSKQIL
jgi:hypothetical protein